MSEVAAPPSPYKGLAPYEHTDPDAFFFFGRERERDMIIANLTAARLTVLYGPTGVGKSSVLQAGVVHRLRELARANVVRGGSPEHAVAIVDTWSGDPVEAVRTAVAEEMGVESSGPLGDALAYWTRMLDGTLFVVLDQFEEYFLYHGGEDVGPFGQELIEMLARRDLRVNVLLSLRDDALAQLDVFKGRIPNLFANPLRLDRLDRRSARAAIVGPIERYNELVAADEKVTVEPAVVETVLDQVAVAKVDLGRTGVGEVRERPEDPRIEAPYLQLVLERLWAAERSHGSRVLRLATLTELGGSEAIVRAHLELALESLSPAQRDVAGSVFNHLVTPSGTKIAHRSRDLAEYAGVEEAELVPVLGTLRRERIVRAVEGNGSRAERYEIFHDVLAEPVLAWRARQRVESERLAGEAKHRRLLGVIAIATLALAAVTAVAVYAFVERGKARSQAGRAHARELEATALADLPVDSQQSLADAYRAARLESGARAENVLRTALIAARRRAVVPVDGTVRSLAYSPDGSLLVAGGQDGRVALISAASDTIVRSLHERAPVTAAGFTARGAVFSGGRGGAHVWDPTTGRRKLTIRTRGTVTSVFTAAHGRLLLVTSTRGPALVVGVSGAAPTELPQPGAAYRGVLDSRGRLAAVAAADRERNVQVRVFDVRSGRLLHVLPPLSVTDVDFNQRGSLLAVGSQDGRTTVWDARSGRELHVLDDDGGAVRDVAFSPNGQFIATASDDGVTRVWVVRSGERLFYLTGHTGHTVGVAWSPDGRLVADASTDGTSRLWAVYRLVGKGAAVAVLPAHSPVASLAFTPDGSTLSSGGADGRVRVWDAHPEEFLAPLGRHRASATTAAFSPDGALVVSTGKDRTARIWDAGRRSLLRVLPLSAPGTSASFGRGHSVLTAAGREVRLWNRDTGRPLRVIRTSAPVRVARLTPGGDLLIAAGRRVELRDAAGGAPSAEVGLPATITAAAVDSAGERLAAADEKGTLGVWSAVGDRLWSSGGVRCDRLAFSHDGKMLAATCGNRALVWDAKTGRRLYALPFQGHIRLTEVVFSPDDRVLLTTRANGEARTWDVRSGRPLHDLVGQFGRIANAAFSADGRWIVTAGPVSAILWQADTGRLLFYLRPDAKQRMTGVAFDSHGHTVLSTSRDGAVRTYNCDVCGTLDELEALARERLSIQR